MKQRGIDMTKVAILGMGVVGQGVYTAIKRSAARGSGLELKYALDIRDFPGAEFEKLVIHDFNIIENDPEVKIVAETIGGAKIAYDFTRRALLAGKSVVTSNKELVATHGAELLRIAAEKGVNYMFEAAVGGGIPLIRPLCQCLRANTINEVYGILNGTTNFILTRMITDGVPFADALAEAQALGYAEADPTDDVEGKDALRKICILASIASGKHIYPEFASSEGITRITSEDVSAANGAGYSIKLLGRYLALPDGRACAYVAPHLVSHENIVSHTNGVFNCVKAHGDIVGGVAFYGRGAGGLATASAVVADLEDCVRFADRTKHPDLWQDGGEENTASTDAVVTRWFVRTSALPSDEFGEIENLGGGAFITAPMSTFDFKNAAEKFAASAQVYSSIRVLPESDI